MRHRGERRGRIGALYLRLDDELVDVVDAAGRAIGAEVFEVAAAGDVVLANAPGNGVADDKAMYCYVPELIAYYLQERPLLESVPTYRTSDETERRIVLERVGELVTKPVDGHGGHGVLIGPDASRRRVAQRRAEIAPTRRAGWPRRWWRCRRIPPSADGGCSPGTWICALSCTFAERRPEDCELAALALTRVAPEGSLVVNSSRGGGAKDTWIIRMTEGGKSRVRTRRRDPVRRTTADVAACERMNVCQEARGPDGAGIWARGPVALGHRRLSIIDLSVRRLAADGGLAAGSERRLQRLHLQLQAAARPSSRAPGSASSRRRTPR